MDNFKVFKVSQAKKLAVGTKFFVGDKLKYLKRLPIL